MYTIFANQVLQKYRLNSVRTNNQAKSESIIWIFQKNSLPLPTLNIINSYINVRLLA